jgi:osmotically-inducible protein OsmY
MILVLSIALLVGATALAQTASGTGSYDQKITQEVQKYLHGEKRLAGVQASVNEGIVTLTGTVDLYLDKANAEEKLRHKDHVAGINNQIQVAGRTVLDAQLRDKIADRLRYDRIDMGQMFNNFSISVKDGVATVSGKVRSYPDKTSAIYIVQATPGVKGVVEKIEVLPTSIMDDELRVRIARAVYRKLPMYANDPQAPIRIVVQNGHVSLYGVVNSNVDRQVADMQARSVPNVFSVENHIVVDSADERAKK